MRIDQIVKVVTGDRQHRLTVHFGIVQTIEQMNAAGSRSCQAYAQAAGEFCISAGHECGRFLVAHLNETDFILSRAQRLDDPVNAVAGQPEDHIDAPIDEHVDQQICASFSHGRFP